LLQRHRALILLAVVLCLPAFLVGQQAYYPQNDDYIYAWSVKKFWWDSNFQFLASSPTCFLPVFLGGIIWKLSGLNFQILHGVSILWLLATGFGVFTMLRKFGLPKVDALLGAAVVWINPLIVNLATCYMTDLPALALNTWAMVFCQRGIYSGKQKDWALCTVCIILSVLCRQTAIILAIATAIIGLILYLSKRRDGALVMARMLLPVCLVFVAEDALVRDTAYIHSYLSYKSKFAAAAYSLMSAGFLEAYRTCLLAIAKSWCYLGFYLLPVSAIAVLSAVPRRSLQTLLIVSLLGSLFLTAMPLVLAYADHQFMPYSFSTLSIPYVGNYCIFHDFIIGWSDDRQKKVTVFCAVAAVVFAESFWLNVTVLLGLSLPRLWQRMRRSFADACTAVVGSNAFYRSLFLFYTLIIFAAFQIFLILQSEVVNFDRYNITLLVPALVICGYAWRFVIRDKHFFRPFAYTFAALMFIYSSVALVDYNNFNHCRWSLIHQLKLQDITSQDIDGGPEFNFWQNPDLFKSEIEASKGFVDEWNYTDRGGLDQAHFRWWPVTMNGYIISNQRFNGYSIYLSQKYWSPLDWRWKTLVALKRNE
jgi:hypothetical protein